MALSRESRALRESYEMFTSEVDPDTVIRKLYSKLLLTRAEKAKVMQTTLTKGQQLDVIFDCLESRVATDPSVFNTLVQVLLEEPALEGVGKKMQGQGRYSCLSALLCEIELGLSLIYAESALMSSFHMTYMYIML